MSYNPYMISTDARKPVEVILDHIEHAGHDRAQLDVLWGSRRKVDEVLAERSPLTESMKHAVSEAWGLPLAMLTSRT